ncbi:MAG: TIGR00270 family protein [Candidatus Heimdallarchaeota archaeon]|nr:TIGR00270 family protein [Candidatus Heimdallarchaeota archaeon]
MCGIEAPVTLVEIDHVELYACPKCAKFGKPIISYPPKKSSTPTKKPVGMKKSEPRTLKPPRKDFLHDKILIDGYGTLIQESRKAKGLGRAEFAKIIKEKETLLARIETEKVLPTDRIVAKIERELNIELKTEVSDETSTTDSFISKSTTLGSIAKIKRKKGK